jgi:glycosyltransferase involved in cell wall biosynthesis
VPDLPGRWRQRPGSRAWSNTIFTAIAAARRPDVLFFPWLVVPRILVAPAVVMLHDVCFRTHPDRFADGGRSGDAVLAAAARSATEVLTPSAESKHGVVAAYGLDERRVNVVRHGIATLFDPARSPADPDALRKFGIAPPYFLCVSTHEPRKNLDVLARAFACYVARGGEAQLVLVGKRSADTPRILESMDRALLLDAVSDAELAALYRQAAAVLFPSVCEGFGFPLLESIACGTPALASDLAVFRELVGDAAVYVPAHDVSAWVAGLQRLSFETCVKQRAMEAAARIRQQFTWRCAADETLRVLGRAAHSRRKLHW